MKLLLFNLGLSNIGDWIYLISLNLIVLDMTGSPFAVAVLYILKPLAALLTNLWSGSLIDRLNQRQLLMMLDLFRGALIIILPFVSSSLILMYSLVLFVNMASAVFKPTSMVYMTKIFPEEGRIRFNALRSLVDSGGFLIGPGIAGVLFWIGSPWIAIYTNGFTFLLSAFLTMLLPKVSNPEEKWGGFSIEEIRGDWQVVSQFSRKHILTMVLYSLFSLLIVLTAAVDSLEAAFSKEMLGLTNTEYGFLVSIAGGGIMLGALIQTWINRALTIRGLIGFGSLFLSIGYLIYASSSGFISGAVGVFLLSFSLAFANTGFFTFYQHYIPTDIMGRVGSVYDWLESFFVIGSVIGLGLIAQFGSIRAAVLVGVITMLILSLGLYRLSKKIDTISDSLQHQELA
ncbi:MFS transporter [Halobacillus locisalis]|uniref:MFS transporter n=1 Tax=Halobacillus locisalis TaxID=220753 RepID=UPI001C67AFBD|nr:MFS transporter [Halobacillus locisalis]